MTLEKYIETTPKGFYLLIDYVYYGPNKLKISAQDLMEDERRWKLYRDRIVGAVDSIDPPDGYIQARVLHLEKGFDLWCKDST